MILHYPVRDSVYDGVVGIHRASHRNDWINTIYITCGRAKQLSCNGATGMARYFACAANLQVFFLLSSSPVGACRSQVCLEPPQMGMGKLIMHSREDREDRDMLQAELCQFCGGRQRPAYKQRRKIAKHTRLSTRILFRDSLTTCALQSLALA